MISFSIYSILRLSSVKQLLIHSEQTKHILPTYRCMNCTQDLISATIGAETVYTRECSDLADPNSYKCDDGQSGITVDLHFSSVIILLKLCKRESCEY